MKHKIALEELRRLSYWLDSCWRIPGTPWRIGVDGVASFVPVAGDTVTALISVWLVWRARELGVPAQVLVRMLGNVGADWVIGSIPVIGTLFDIAFRANNKNMSLLVRHLEEHVARHEASTDTVGAVSLPITIRRR